MRLVIALFALLALTASARAETGPDWGTAEEVEVRLSSFAFSPDRIELSAGRPYLLRLINTGKGGHDFRAPRFFAGATIAAGDRAKLDEGGIEVPSNDTVTVRLVAPAAGTYKLQCSHFLHDGFGMNGEIVVR